jgi:hypothetical protein
MRHIPAPRWRSPAYGVKANRIIDDSRCFRKRYLWLTDTPDPVHEREATAAAEQGVVADRLAARKIVGFLRDRLIRPFPGYGRRTSASLQPSWALSEAFTAVQNKQAAPGQHGSFSAPTIVFLWHLSDMTVKGSTDQTTWHVVARRDRHTRVSGTNAGT